MTNSMAKIQEWSEDFQRTPLARNVVTGLRGSGAEIWKRTFELLQRESPEYRNSVDEKFTNESKSHCRELLNAIITIAEGHAKISSVDPFDFVRTHAGWRARHQVPLTASLHAYRLAHKTYWWITREALFRHAKREEALLSLTMLSEFWMEFFDYVGAILAEAHSVEEGLSVAKNSQAYFGLIDDLLSGIEPRNAEAVRLRALCGIRSRAPKAVVVGRPFQLENGKEIDIEVTLRSLVRLIQEVLPSAVFGKLVHVRNGEVTVIVCSDTDPSRDFLNVMRRQGFGRRAANGLAVGFGASLNMTEVARLPESHEEARLALDFTSATQPLMHFSDINLAQYLIQRSDSAALRLIPEWTRHLKANDDGKSGELARTVDIFTDCSLNVKQTARRLGVHTNTIYFRLNQIKKLTGIDPRTFSGATQLLTALRLQQIRAKGK